MIVLDIAISSTELYEERGDGMSTSDEAISHHSLHFERSGYSREPRGNPRYRDPANPARTWSGLGKSPAWVRDYIARGRKLSEFEIKEV